MDRISDYADSAQARQQDQNHERGEDTLRPRITQAELDAYQQSLRDAEARQQERSKATVKRGLAELREFFYGPQG